MEEFSCNSEHIISIEPTPSKHGTLYLMLLAQVTGATNTNEKVIATERGRGGGIVNRAASWRP